MINEDIAQEILHQLFSSLEALETQSAAVLQFLKDKGIASEEELAVHLEQAGKASSVRWRAARVRMDHLLSSAIKASAEETPRSEQAKSSAENKKPAVKATRKTSHGKKCGSIFQRGARKRDSRHSEICYERQIRNTGGAASRG
jgi:PAB1-binding protein PBP1